MIKVCLQHGIVIGPDANTRCLLQMNKYISCQRTVSITTFFTYFTYRTWIYFIHESKRSIAKELHQLAPLFLTVHVFVFDLVPVSLIRP